MGVHGLWRLIEPSGKPVPLETLENKILAVDISIWLHQAIKGYRDSKGGTVANAHLLGVYHRLCKLLYYRIRPVFVFDGGVPLLKKQTIVKRNQLKYQHEDESEKLHQQILTTLLKQSAIDTILLENLTQAIPQTKTSPTKNTRKNDNSDDIFKLPELPSITNELSTTIETSTDNATDSDDSPVSHKYHIDIDSIDEKSHKFKSLPANVRHDILTEIKENSKNVSWRKLYVTPVENGEFSKYQIQRVLKRRSIQVSLEEAEKEMGGVTLSLGDLEALLCQEGIVSTSRTVAKSRIASDDSTRYLLIKDLQKTKKEAELTKFELTREEKQDEIENETKDVNVIAELKNTNEMPLKVDKEDSINIFNQPSTSKNIGGTICDSDLELAIQLSLQSEIEDEVSISNSTQNTSKDPDLETAIQLSLESKVTNSVVNVSTDPDLETAIKLSLQSEIKDKPSTSKTEDSDLETTIKLSSQTSQSEFNELSYLKNFNDGDFIFESSSDDENLTPVASGATSLAKAYLAEYSDFTPAEIDTFLNIQKKTTKELKSKDFYPNEMILNSPKSKKLKSLIEQSRDKADMSRNLEVISKHIKEIPKKKEDMSTIIEISTNKKDIAINVKETSENKEGLFKNLEISKDIEVSKDKKDESKNIKDTSEKKEYLSKNIDDVFKNMENLFKNNESVSENNEDVAIMSDSNSDDSDFIEIKENSEDEIVSNNETNASSKNSEQSLEMKNINIEKQSVLEVVIKPHDVVEDDLFSDIFIESQDRLDKNMKERERKGDVVVENESKSNAEKQAAQANSKKNMEEKTVETKICTNISQVELTSVTDDRSVSFKSDIEKKNNLCDSSIIDQSKKRKIEKPKISKEKLMQLKSNLEATHENLLKEKAYEERMANSISDQMYQDTQELLKLFGVPYIVAPMEAEAQCAYLDDINLTDGTITDDSDIWLFGGKTVYKNFFSDKKNVLEFRAENIQHQFKLSRRQLILLALLVGSDYTLGIQGVGPVTALEILAAFSPSKQETTIVTQDELISGLQHFKNWWRSGKLVGPGKTSLRNKLKNIQLLEGFPSLQVVDAYLKPEIDLSKEKFTWGKPNVEKLREYAKSKFGWSEIKSNEILIPVMKRWQDPKSQKSILAYFNARPLKNTEMQLSKRVKRALYKLENNNSDSEEDQNPKKLKRSKRAPKDENPANSKNTDTKSKPKKTKKSTTDLSDTSINSHTNSTKINVTNQYSVNLEDTKSKSSSNGAANKKVYNKTGKCKKLKPNEPAVVTLDVDIKPLNKIQEKLQHFKRVQPAKSQELIPQREKDKINALKTKLRAIELYRKSKQGPGFVQKRMKIQKSFKDEAELSEDSSD